MSVYGSFNSTSRSSVGTAFDAAKSHTHVMNAADPRRVSGETFRGWFRTVVVQLSSISTAATLTLRICRDSAGDEIIVPDTDATIVTGVATATDGAIAYKIDIPYVDHADNDSYYLFFKVNAGSVTVDSSNFSWTDS